MQVNKQGFEVESCSRCAATGQHSYCTAYGSTCFKCRGAGLVLTKRGKTARAELDAMLIKPVTTLKVGSWVYYDKWMQIKKISDYNENQLMVSFDKLEVIFSKTRTATAVDSQDEYKNLLKQAIEFQATLTKTGKVKK